MLVIALNDIDYLCDQLGSLNTHTQLLGFCFEECDDEVRKAESQIFGGRVEDLESHLKDFDAVGLCEALERTYHIHKTLDNLVDEWVAAHFNPYLAHYLQNQLRRLFVFQLLR